MNARVRARSAALVTVLALMGFAPRGGLAAQDSAVRDLVVFEGDVPVRLMGYGLVVGLDGTGDKVIGGFSSGHTVRSVANLLRRFDIEVPEEMLRTRNVAAVLVTAEASPYLRPGGRFDVQVASVGDASSLRGGVLWSTPLVAGPTDPPVGTAQGPVAVSEAGSTWGAGGTYSVETTVALPDGGVLEQPLPATPAPDGRALYLRKPDAATATRIAAAINEAMGDGHAVVVDPGAIELSLTPEDTVTPGSAIALIGDIRVRRGRAALVIIDARSGTVAAGGDITLGEAVVSHGTLTLTIGVGADTDVPGAMRMSPGATVQDVATALHGVAAPPQAIGAIFRSLKDVGALTAEISIR